MECFKHALILDRKEQVSLFMVTITANFHSKINWKKNNGKKIDSCLLSIDKYILIISDPLTLDISEWMYFILKFIFL